jgi:hypothetical protein
MKGARSFLANVSRFKALALNFIGAIDIDSAAEIAAQHITPVLIQRENLFRFAVNENRRAARNGQLALAGFGLLAISWQTALLWFLPT